MYYIQALTGPSAGTTEASSLNAGGDVVGSAYAMGGAGAIWRVGGPASFFPANGQSFLTDINDQGAAVGVRGTNNSPTEIAILVSAAGTVVDLDDRVGIGSLATGINASGIVCGWSWNDDRGFLLDSNTHGPTHYVGPLPGSSDTVPLKISNDGAVVGTSGERGFHYKDAVLTDLGEAAFVEDVNEVGQVVGSLGKAWPQAFGAAIWDVNGAAPTVTEIPPPSGFLGCHGNGINASGDVVGTCWTAQSYDGLQSAYLYQNGASTDLNGLIAPGSGWHLVYAEKINDQGDIVGQGVLNGEPTAFVLSLAPRPTGPSGPAVVPSFNLPMLVAILIFGGVTVDGGGIVVLPGGPPIPVGPLGWASLAPAKRDVLIGLALDELATHIEDRAVRETVRRATLESVRGRVEHLLGSAAGGRPAAAGVERFSSGKPRSRSRHRRLRPPSSA